jgi:DNA (cytosine-5)-methyltransferase 1
MPTAVSLFSGCGGSDAGVVAAGFNVLMANDLLPYAKDVYEANHPATDYRVGDVTRITTFPAAELLIGCYPCQGFSQGGLRNPDNKLNKLYLEFARALRAIRPKAFIVRTSRGHGAQKLRASSGGTIQGVSRGGRYRVKADVLKRRRLRRGAGA